jgi:hypothetical protein
MNWMVQNMDELPYPDFLDYFNQRSALASISEETRPVLVFETARGCWWGQKSHCTFCGLNGVSMKYRSKSQKRAYEELIYLSTRFSKEVLVVDNILDLKYFDEFIPLLVDADTGLSIHYETKVNLRPWQVSMLADAGICKLQPGIETLCTNVLKLMKRGCTMLQNVQNALGKADMGIAAQYAELVEDAELRQTLFGVIREEFERTREWILRLTGQHDILDNEPVLQRAIMLRNPYVDPLNFIQIELMRRLRTLDENDTEGRAELMDAMVVTINGIAAGLRNTG